MSKVYGIYQGAYSDWNAIGYFTNKEDAERYCAVKNATRKMYDDDYYVMTLEELTEDFKDVKLRYYHYVVFQYLPWSKFEQNEMVKNAYYVETYVGEKKQPMINFNSFNHRIKFMIDAPTRERAEKIAQDNYYNFLNCYKLTQDYEQAIRMVAERFEGEDNE